MLTDIETLQREIETFHKNVKYSNELTALLSNIISALSDEAKLFDERVKALEASVAATPDQLKSGNQDLIQQTLDNINRAKSDYETALRGYLDELKAVPKSISDTNNAQYNEFLASVKKEYGDYVAVLRESQAKMEKISTELDNKYNAFLAKMESTNMDQIYKVCQDMDKKLNTKLTMILAGVAVAIVLSVIAIIL
jgi:uncharacterized phage infection (PIP) family protein YhgE